MMPTHNFIDLSGQRFGKWLVLHRDESRQRCSDAYWICRCDCGAEHPVTGNRLRVGRSRSCKSCSQQVHGHTRFGRKSTEFSVWSDMIRRCSDPKRKRYADYGGRGIVVCERWLSFENFLADMGPRPEGTSLDRLFNDHDYAPTNCRWRTRREQARNARSNRPLELNGITKILCVWAEELGVDPRTISKRLKRGWSVARALTGPSRATM